MGEVLSAVNAVSPLGLAVLLAYVIYLLISQRGKVQELGDNHLHDVTARLDAVIASLGRLETGQQLHEENTTQVREALAHIKAKLNGAPK